MTVTVSHLSLHTQLVFSSSARAITLSRSSSHPHPPYSIFRISHTKSLPEPLLKLTIVRILFNRIRQRDGRPLNR
ncbi:hypothetical protein SISNIDRAFT_460402 [Sistotremastrum niveocremeum HHB9708]|uniref:Uncharacterized protein n=1 Tax=Sistotremastrum niveocremeum HHB9708 TaxID=1314777 RepID=A0A164NQR7_9AGAM|nr:hypothetical protein SISNIDRAFT_460402 [Sistotremastrum niveocremeum HHB9708]